MTLITSSKILKFYKWIGSLVGIWFAMYPLAAQDIYTPQQITDIKLTFRQDNWFQKLKANKDKKEYLLAGLEVNGVRYDSVGVRFKGNSSYNSISKKEKKKLPFNIKVNYIKKDQVLAGGHTNLKLSNVFRDPSYVREVLSYEIARKYIAAPKANFARVTINGEVFGIYTNVESVDKAFLKNHYPEATILVKADPETAAPKPAQCPPATLPNLAYMGDDSLCYARFYEMDAQSNWKDFIQLTKVMAKMPQQLDQYIDVNKFLWWIALNNVLVNLDSYLGNLAHNYYVLKNGQQHYEPVIWDLNMSFGGFRFADIDKPLTDEAMIQLPLLHWADNKNRPLLNTLLNVPQYRKMYMAHVKTIVDENFANGWYLQRAKEWQQQIQESVRIEQNRLYPHELLSQNLQTSVQLDDKVKIIGIQELMEARVRFLQQQLSPASAAPVVTAPTVAKPDSLLVVTFAVQQAQQLTLTYKSDTQPTPMTVVLKDNGKNGDEKSGDGLFTVQLPCGPTYYYYLFAENNTSGVWYPLHTQYIKLSTPISSQ